MDWISWAKMVFALIATLSLLGLAAYAARRFGLLVPGGTPGALRRMKVQESLMLDARRRLVIVSCDAREHILLLSPAGDVVVASGDSKAKSEGGVAS